jgi:hypothetical protein
MTKILTTMQILALSAALIAAGAGPAMATDYGRYDTYAQSACDTYQRMSRAWREGLLTVSRAQYDYQIALALAAKSNSPQLRAIVADHYQHANEPERNASRFEDYCRHVPTWTHSR